MPNAGNAAAFNTTISDNSENVQSIDIEANPNVSEMIKMGWTEADARRVIVIHVSSKTDIKCPDLARRLRNAITIS